MTQITVPHEGLTCTIGPNSEGNRCGAPAVTAFTSSSDDHTKVYAECERHDASGIVGRTPGSAITVGAKVKVRHVGKDKIGTVIKVGPVNARVEVPLGGGGTKTIIVPLTELELA